MNDITDGELVPATPSTIELIAAAEIDRQIATAHRFPRSMALFKKRALEMVSLDEETAQSCIYRRPVGKKKDDSGKWVTEFAEGMSIRMAEIVGACYGNLRVGAMLANQTERQVIARGVAHDLESNFSSAAEVIEATVDKNGVPYSERMRVVVAKAALSKARRDATFAVVPRALCKAIEEQARAVAVGDATTLDRRRRAVMQWIEKVGAAPARVFAALGVTGEADIGLDQLETLTGLKTAIKDGETSLEEAFPPLGSEDAPKGPQRKSAKATDPATPPAPSTPPPPPSTEAPKSSSAGAPPAPNHKGAPLADPAERDFIRTKLAALNIPLERALMECGITNFDALSADGYIALRDYIREQK